jgi:hypothetical protein
MSIELSSSCKEVRRDATDDDRDSAIVNYSADSCERASVSGLNEAMFDKSDISLERGRGAQKNACLQTG